MTSKEKLLQLRKDFYLNKPVDYDSISYFTAIEKDLSALEIIKNHIEVNELEYLYKGEPRYVYYVDLLKKNLTKEEYELLKEGLNVQ